MTQHVFVSYLGILPIDDVKVTTDNICRLTGAKKISSFDVKLDIQLGETLFCNVSFKESAPYEIDRDKYYTEVQTKEQQIQLVDRTIFTLSSIGTVLPDIVKLWSTYGSETSDSTVLKAVADLESSVINNAVSFGRYLRVASAVATLMVACSDGKLVPTHAEYPHIVALRSPVSTLLYRSLIRLFEL